MNKHPRRLTHQDLEAFFSNCTKNWKKPSRGIDFRNYQIMDIRKIWELVASRSLAVHSFPQKIKMDTLWVTTDHSVFAQSVKMLEKDILQRLYKESGIVIKRLRTTVNSNTQTLNRRQTQNLKGYIKGEDLMSSPKKMTPMEIKFEEFVEKISKLA